MKNIIWKKPDGAIAITSIRGSRYTLKDVKNSNPAFTHDQSVDELSSLEANWPKNSQHHAEQIIEEAKRSWEIEKKTDPTAQKPEVLDWVAVAFDIDTPSDRTFRNAWEHNGEHIHIHVGKAKEIKKDRLRKQRESLFKALDGKRAVAVRNNKSTSEIDAEAQRLADITNQVDQAKTIEELHSIVI